MGRSLGTVRNDWRTAPWDTDRMSDRTLRRLAWAALGAVTLLLAAGVGLMWATRHVAHSEGFSGGGIAGFIAGLLIATGLSWALVVDAIGYGDWAFKVHPGQIPGGAVVASVSLWAWAPAVA